VSERRPGGASSEMDSRHSIDGLRVVITGGSMGIGYACAELALAAGARVLIAARGVAELETAAEALTAASGTEVGWASADVGEPIDVGRLFAAVERRLGGVDAVIHAAALLGPIGPAIDADPVAWIEAVRANLVGSFLVAREAARLMRRGGSGGRIVLFSGGGATTPFPNFSAYGASKAGVVRLTETLAVELAAERIAVNCVAPGLVATRMQTQTLAAGPRAGDGYVAAVREKLADGAVPAALAAAAARFLISQASDGITGRLLAAPWDDWRAWPDRREEIAASDLFTLRRIVPADRGLDWH
jgi:NAD(P)-dependent dehydrogenase (short-subunit alcohol dehydrogenase family)